MTDFSTIGVDAGEESEAIASPSASVAGGGAVESGAGNIFSRRKPKKSSGSNLTAATNTVVGAYISKVQRLADAKEGDPSNSSKYETLARAEWRKMSAANPFASGALAKAHKDFAEPSGLGPLVQDVGREKRAAQARWDAGVSAGAIDTSATREEQEKQAKSYNAQLSLENRLNAQESANEGQARKEFDLYSQVWLTNSGQAYTTILNNNTGDADQLAAVEGRFTEQMDQLDRLAGSLNDPDAIDSARLILTRHKDIAEKKIKGTYTKEAAEAELGLLTAKLELAFAGTKGGRIAIIADGTHTDSSKYLPTIMSDIAGVAEASLLSDMPDPDISNSGEKNQAAIKGHLEGIVLPSAKAFQNGTLSEQGRESMITTLNSVLKGVKTYSVAWEDPQAGRNVAHYLAEGPLGDFMIANSTELGKWSFAASEVLRGLYAQELEGALKNEVGGTTGISAVWKNGGVQFVGGSGPMDQFTLNKLNKPTNAGLVNDYVRANAHLEGTKDYEKWWNENKSTMIPVSMDPDQPDDPFGEGGDKDLGEIADRAGVGGEFFSELASRVAKIPERMELMGEFKKQTGEDMFSDPAGFSKFVDDNTKTGFEDASDEELMDF